MAVLYYIYVIVIYMYTYIHKDTANLIIIDARYHDFNDFPVVNWYWKPLKAGNGRQLLWEWQYYIYVFLHPNDFPVVNWYWKPLKAGNGRQLLWYWQDEWLYCITYMS